MTDGKLISPGEYLFLIKDITDRRLTGILKVRKAEPECDFHFKLGDLTYIYSLPDEKPLISHFLLEADCSPVDIEKAVGMFDSGTVCANILSSGIMKKSELEQLTGRFISKSLAEISRTRDIDLYFEEKEPIDGCITLSFGEILMKTARDLKYDELGKNRLSSKNPSVKLNEDPEKLDSYDLSLEEGFLLSRIAGISSMEEVTAVSGLPEDKLDRLLVILSLGKLITIKPEPSFFLKADELKRERPETAGKEKKRPQKSAGDKRGEFDDRFVLRLYEKMDRMDYYEVLGIPRSAGKAEIKKAYHERARSLHPDRYTAYEGRVERNQLEAVFSAVNEAYATLNDPKLKGKYDEGTSGQESYRKDDKITRAKEAFDRGVKYFKQENYHQALQLFMKAAQLNPSARHLTCLGKTQAKNEKWRKKAEENLNRAIEMNPQEWEAHFHLGLIYKEEGMAQRAKKSFQEALKLNPGDEEIEEALRELENDGKNEKTGGLKGLFSRKK